MTLLNETYRNKIDYFLGIDTDTRCKILIRPQAENVETDEASNIGATWEFQGNELENYEWGIPWFAKVKNGNGSIIKLRMTSIDMIRV